MKLSPLFLLEDGFIPCLPVYNRDGVYCCPNARLPNNRYWFEYNGTAWTVPDQSREVEQLRHELLTTDDQILSSREVDAMNTILHISRDADIKKRIRKRLSVHYQAFDNRMTYRNARKYMLRY
jgi:hypothetical protein